MRIAAVDPCRDPAVRRVVCDAFGSEVEYALIEDLRADPHAWVAEWSIGAFDGGELVGHILFTRAHAGDVAAALLAPLAVSSAHQSQGVGLALIREGLKVVAADGAAIALVLGHPGYYPRAGFAPALPYGIEPPYPVDPAEAWMVAELVPGALDRATGALEMSAVFMDPALWRE